MHQFLRVSMAGHRLKKKKKVCLHLEKRRAEPNSSFNEDTINALRVPLLRLEGTRKTSLSPPSCLKQHIHKPGTGVIDLFNKYQ